VLQTAPVDQRVPSEIILPWDTFAHCQPGCRDLRLIDDRAQETPFEQLIDRGVSSTAVHSARLLENSFVATQYTQVIADLGDTPPAYNQVRVLTDQPDFIVWAELALSDDAHTWRVVEPRAPISRFRARAVEGTQSIAFQGLNARYLRIRIFDPATQFPVTGVDALNCVSREPERVTLPVPLVPESSPDNSQTRWRADLDSANLPISAAVFSTDQPEFYRAVLIESSVDGKEWYPHTSGEIYRYQHAGKLRESLRLDFSEAVGPRFWRVEILNGNDQPISNSRVAFQGVVRKIAFRAEPGRAYRLIYGNDRAAAPSYDLSHYLNVGADQPTLRVLTVGNEEPNSNYADPRPFTEQHPNLLWLALALAVIALMYTALRALRTPKQPVP
jgi:hypothetical protein